MHDLQKWLNSYPPCVKRVLPCVTLESVSQAEYIPPSFLFWWGQLKSESMRYQLRPSEPVCFHFLTLTPVLSTGHPLTSLLESKRHGAEPRFPACPSGGDPRSCNSQFTDTWSSPAKISGTALPTPDSPQTYKQYCFWFCATEGFRFCYTTF